MKTKRWLAFLVASISIITLVMMVSSITGAAPQNNQINVGYVDTDKLHQELPDYKELQVFAQEKENGFKNFQGYLLSQHRLALKEIQDKAAKEKEGKSAEDQTAIDKRYQEEVKKKTEALNSQLEKEQKKILQEFNDKKKVADEQTKAIISDVANDKKLSVVFDKNSVLFGGTDITDLVIQKAKKDAKKEEKEEAKKGRKS